MYQPKSFDHLMGTPDFSDALLANHFALYKGYVTNVNKLTELLATFQTMEKKRALEYSELKRRFGWEYNGMRLHEYYFENIVHDEEKNAPNVDSKLAEALGKYFGGHEDWAYENWKEDFGATGEMRGIGWAILYKDRETGNLFNTWVTEHDMGHLAGATPLVVLDVFEHAYMLDYGIKRVDYVNAFMNAINWEVVEKRFNNT
ncbi:MAG: superoxide dismutase [Parcubacteria group bacterium]|nr:superoxide dismutase [Parcubacteria group bacterium]